MGPRRYGTVDGLFLLIFIKTPKKGPFIFLSTVKIFSGSALSYGTHALDSGVSTEAQI